MRKILLTLSIYLMMVFQAPCYVFQPSVDSIDPKQPLTWVYSNPVDFGCMMEKKLGYKDAGYHCSTQRILPGGNPCKADERYYDGPQIPETLLYRINPKIKEVRIEWEDEQLRELEIDFKQYLSKAEVKKVLGNPLHDARQDDEPELSPSINTAQCTQGISCVIEGFIHMGAGDVDCP